MDKNNFTSENNCQDKIICEDNVLKLPTVEILINNFIVMVNLKYKKKTLCCKYNIKHVMKYYIYEIYTYIMKYLHWNK